MVDSSGPYSMVIHVVEHFFGKTILHIEVDIPNDMYDPIVYDITFRINCTLAGTEGEQALPLQTVKVFPNPSGSYTTFVFSNPEQKPHTLSIMNLQGQTVYKQEAVTG